MINYGDSTHHMSKFRQHRGGLWESMQTVEPCTSMAQLRTICSRLSHIPDPNIRIVYSGRDERVGWDTYYVEVVGYGVVGMVDGTEITPSACSGLRGLSRFLNRDK